MEATSERPKPVTMREALAALHVEAFGWALSCCGRDRWLAEEVVRIAYLKALSGQARFDGRSSLKTWLFAVIQHTATSERRRAWSLVSLLTRFARLRPDLPAGPHEAGAEESREAARLVEALRRLSRRQREVLHLVFYQEMTIEQTAGVLGLSIGATRTHYERGKRRLRALLSNEAPR